MKTYALVYVTAHDWMLIAVFKDDFYGWSDGSEHWPKDEFAHNNKNNIVVYNPNLSLMKLVKIDLQHSFCLDISQ